MRNESLDGTPEEIALAEEAVDVLSMLGRLTDIPRKEQILGLVRSTHLMKKESLEIRRHFISVVTHVFAKSENDPVRATFVAEQYETLLCRLLDVPRSEPQLPDLTT